MIFAFHVVLLLLDRNILYSHYLFSVVEFLSDLHLISLFTLQAYTYLLSHSRSESQYVCKQVFSLPR